MSIALRDAERILAALEGAIDQLERCPYEGRIWAWVAELWLALHDDATAALAFDQLLILGLSPSTPAVAADVYLDAGDCFARLERWQDAERAYLSALAADPAHERARRHLKALRSRVH